MPLFDATASWIWSESETRSYHHVVCFRRTLNVGDEIIAGRLLITADARYEVYVNGQWLGHGPVRSWLSPWPVDEYDIRGLLKPGKNVVAVLVQHFGLSTFQYIHADSGLIAQLSWRDNTGEHQLATDHQWLCHHHEGYRWPVSRLSCMQAWEEQYDSWSMPADWMNADFDDASWAAAKVLYPAGQGPHAEFVARDIPMLTRDPVDPVRVMTIDAVRPAPYTWSLNPRDFANATDKTANHLRGNMLMMTHIYSEQAQTIEFHQPHTRPFLKWKLNGELLDFNDFTQHKTDTGVARAQLKAGWNTLITRLPGMEHYWWAVINAWTQQPVRWSARREADSGESRWLAIGPFGAVTAPHEPPRDTHKVVVNVEEVHPDATLAKMEDIWSHGALSDAETTAPYVRDMRRYMVVDVDVYAQCASERTVPGVTPRVDDPLAMQSQSAQWTTIYPTGDGSDVRILLDFGREVIGFHEFEIDAPAGAIVDNHNFEFIQPDGRYNLAEGMNNSFRYICREGAQHYRTILRRGFRYSWFSFRNFNRPIRVRFIRVLMSTYPQARKGSFACSDAWFDRIWEAGAHSVACCSEDTYTDCPTYEQTFWVGDARNEALVDLVANGDPRLSSHAWRVAAQSLDRSVLVESQVPSGWENILPAWSFLWMRWAQEHYQLTGDPEFAKSALVSLGRNIEGIEKHISPRGLFKIRAWNMFDWAPMDTPSDGELTHLNCLAIMGIRQAVMMARDFGAKAQAAKWTKLADKLADAVNKHLWDAKRNAYIDCIHVDGRRSQVLSQQTHTVAFMAGVAKGARLKRCQEIMLKAPKGFVSAGSPFYMFFLLEGLARLGLYKPMLKVIRDYWGKQVEAGATTFWESYHPDASRMTRSHCHGWSAAPTYFLSQFVLGVQPAQPGYATVRVAPQPGGLAWARGSVPTPHGVVECAWKRQGKSFSMRLVLPAGIPAVLEIPATGKITVASGKIKKLGASRGITRLQAAGGVIDVKVG